jgi:hypothetical protein
MNYTVRVIKEAVGDEPREVVAVKQFHEHPSEDTLDQLVAETGGDFADVCRSETNV